jgi:hypothetical protein
MNIFRAIASLQAAVSASSKFSSRPSQCLRSTLDHGDPCLQRRALGAKAEPDLKKAAQSKYSRTIDARG